jgi:hypothetical protein
LTSIGMFWFVLRLMRVAIVPFPKTTLASRRHVRYSLRTEVKPVATASRRIVNAMAMSFLEDVLCDWGEAILLPFWIPPQVFWKT